METDVGRGPAAAALPEQARRIRAQGRDIYLVGTAHVSPESVEDVRRTIDLVEPDTVCVELCHARHQAFTDRKSVV